MTRPQLVAKPVIPAGMRSVIVVLAVLPALAVALLAVPLHESHGPCPFDRVVGARVRGVWPDAGHGAHLVDHLAAPVSAAVIVGLLVVACVGARLWRLALVAAIGPLSAAAATNVVKPLVMRTIHGENLAFPSGHTAFATAVGLLCGLLWIGLYRPRRAVSLVVVMGLAVLFGVGMALDQIALDAHYPTDTVGGFFTATTVIFVTALLVDYLADWQSQLTARHSWPRRTSSG